MKKRRLKKSVVGTLYILFLILLGILLFLVFGKKKNELKEKTIDEPVVEKEVWPKEYNLSMVATGDCLIHSSLYREAKEKDGTYDFCKMMTKIRPLVENMI